MQSAIRWWDAESDSRGAPVKHSPDRASSERGYRAEDHVLRILAENEMLRSTMAAYRCAQSSGGCRAPFCNHLGAESSPTPTQIHTLFFVHSNMETKDTRLNAALETTRQLLQRAEQREERIVRIYDQASLESPASHARLFPHR
jgi:hypothetical protein